MKIKTTQTLCKFLSEKLKENDITKDYKITREKVTPAFFIWSIDFDCWKHQQADYDPSTSKFNVFKIKYPPEYCACDKYITTKNLAQIFNKCDHTTNGFVQAFISFIEI